jgi:FkbM family methyltransferase
MLHQQLRDQIAAAIADRGWQSFEEPMPAVYFSHVKRVRGLVLDIGVNTGFYAFLATAAADLNRVLCFEPNPTVRSYLEQNIELNRLSDRVNVSPLALSNREGYGDLYVPDPSHGLVETASSLEAEFIAVHYAVMEVAVSTLDTVLRSAAWERQRVTTIKIDVEGHERDVLEGAASTISKWRPIIFIEILTRANHEALSRMIAAQGYLDIPLRPDGLAARSMVAFDPAAWNHAFVPGDRVRDFLRVATCAS